jgi:hypothetical protein
MPIYLSTVEKPGPDQLTIVLAPDGGAAWKAYFDLTPDGLTKLAHEQRARAWRPITLNTYHDRGATRLLAVFAENQRGIEWDCRVGMSGEDYEQALQALREAGLRPRAVASWRDADVVHYAAVWEDSRARQETTPQRDVSETRRDP